MRVVSLVPSHTETLHELGVWDDVVGVTSFCIHPPSALEEKAVVGGTKSPSLDRILDLDPDLVVVAVEENPREVVEALEEADVEVLVTDIRDVPGAADAVEAIGEAVGAPGAAGSLAREIRQAVEAAREEARGKRRVRLFCPIWRDPWMTVSGDTYSGDLLDLVGTDNPWADADEWYPEIPLEEVREAGVEAVLLPSEPYEFGPGDREDVAEALDLPPGRVRLVDGEALEWYGARTPAGLRAIADAVDQVRRVLY